MRRRCSSMSWSRPPPTIFAITRCIFSRSLRRSYLGSCHGGRCRRSTSVERGRACSYLLLRLGMAVSSVSILTTDRLGERIAFREDLRSNDHYDYLAHADILTIGQAMTGVPARAPGKSREPNAQSNEPSFGCFPTCCCALRLCLSRSPCIIPAARAPHARHHP